MIDTHTHIYLDQFEGDRAEMLQRAKENGVEKFYLPNIDSTSIDAMLQLEKDYPETCIAMMGLHPCSVKENYKEELALVKEWLDKRYFCAIGEIGIDLYWDKSTFEIQKEAFQTQINWAKELDIPIVIHSRNSTNEVIEILRKEKDDRLRGIFHCFGGSVEEANAIIELGFHLGIGGVVTFKKSGLDKTMEQVSLKNVVLETDSPYLTPTPFRGKRNESGYVKLVAEKLATIKGVPLQEVSRITTENARSVFGEKKKISITLTETKQ
ncbi:MAG TPA: TatD family deoxyribonuclease [Phaeodactylibacter sp.]|nr:TatD family deoxyribonuclease [Phaeodactylibacter sp.]